MLTQPPYPFLSPPLTPPPCSGAIEEGTHPTNAGQMHIGPLPNTPPSMHQDGFEAKMSVLVASDRSGGSSLLTRHIAHDNAASTVGRYDKGIRQKYRS